MVQKDDKVSIGWKEVWKNKPLRNTIFAGLILMVLILMFFPVFFAYIEKKQGARLNDMLLNHLPALDLSIPIFILIWGGTAIIIYKCLKRPYVFALFLWAYIILCISRIITISLIPLEAPNGLIPLTDPLSNIFYGGTFIRKDLFYSGHVSTQFLISLCIYNKVYKRIMQVTTLMLAVMVLLQHVHYSIDVVAAPIFAYCCFWLSRFVIKKNILLHN
jgi:hypothetical protein